MQPFYAPYRSVTARPHAARYACLKRHCFALLLTLAPTEALLAQTTTFSYSGDTRSYTVPLGVTSLQVVATGAAGGRYDASTASSPGAQVSATLTVTPGEILFVVVGGQGTGGSSVNAGGYNGGGTGSGGAGAGGGATELRRAIVVGPTYDYLSARNALLVAGGGGGSDGGGAVGGTGGTPTGGDGVKNNAGIAGGGATQTAAGGTGTLAGTNNQGGKGSSGGGGGGGYYGGGGGAPSSGSAGGGGGSSWVTTMGSSTVTYRTAATSGDGSLSITPVLTPLPVRSAVAPGNLSVFPNPTATGATLTGAAAGSPVHVLDALGRDVFTTTTDASGTARLPAMLPSGVYLVWVGPHATRLRVE
ncbi:T9SS type A sorting domain-containing protein [Hymenobacter sp. GOD-10R]|uniref:T9SS type A sorting domain-containing protein n=1 Tax=Hymenobacter sp. GOD-10R TaxID=3093922 RepID=UPI002D78C83C|nr:T9SS type A sorting domain-containing protein [Hymenobacter sp. GOD-10R]WRQ27679.1 T9SS type A sorting domain-containing protein [Hymenobacter sp. GOD-10R]